MTKVYNYIAFYCKKCKRNFKTSVYKSFDDYLMCECGFCGNRVIRKFKLCLNCNSLILKQHRSKKFCSQNCRWNYHNAIGRGIR